jgi:hypothetical protein
MRKLSYFLAALATVAIAAPAAAQDKPMMDKGMHHDMAMHHHHMAMHHHHMMMHHRMRHMHHEMKKEGM